MKNHQVNLIVARLLSGVSEYNVRGRTFVFSAPTLHVLQRAESYYQEILDQNKFESCIRSEQIVPILVQQGLWDTKRQVEFNSIDEKIENCKMEMYVDFVNNIDLKPTRKKLAKLKKQETKLFYIRHSLDHITLEGYASALKNEFIIIESTTMDGEKLSSDIDMKILNQLICKIKASEILPSQYRFIARNDPWTSYWAASKDNIFGVCGAQMNDEQRAIIAYSKMYENAFNSMERPKKEVIEDDDLFDGWMIKQRRDQDSQDTRSVAESKMSDKVKRHQNIAVFSQDNRDIRNIQNINSPKNKEIMKKRLGSG